MGTFQGFFKDGKKYGEGAFHWKNGARFEGEYEDDMKNGPGIMYNPNGILVLKTVWQNDKPLIQTNNSKIAWLMVLLTYQLFLLFASNFL